MFQLLLIMIYLAFISLGLPDSLLGSAWPMMYQEFSVPVSYAGIVSMIISVGTIISSLQSDRMTRRFGTGKVTAFSVLITAVALFGFSGSHSYLELCLWAIPYGLGAGSVDASLNNYVALHYASRHMSWLHCMWGVGASAGPYIMGFALTSGRGWNMGYRYIGMLQLLLAAALIVTLPIWNRQGAGGSGTGKESQESVGTEKTETAAHLSIPQILRIPGAREILITFFCYCALEQTAGLWASSYLVLLRGLSPETAARYAGLFFIGITVGRGISGFITMKLNDTQMIRLGQGIILSGIFLLCLPFGSAGSQAGLILIGLGCAPIYPSIIHSTPARFGADKSQAIIGVQMAFAYMGNCLMPPLFGFLANHMSVGLFPVYLFVILLLMVLMHEKMLKKAEGVSFRKPE